MGQYNVSLSCRLRVFPPTVQQGNPPRRFKQGVRKSKDNFSPSDLLADIRNSELKQVLRTLFFPGMLSMFISEQVLTSLYTNNIKNHYNTV